jgi:two-component system sensor histidine kinase MprB
VTSWIHRRSFQGRLTTLVAVAVGVAIALSAACSYLIVRNQLYGQVDQHLKSYLSKSANGPRLNVQQAANVALQAGYTVEAFPTVGAPSNLSGEPGALTLTPTSGLRALADAPRGTVALGTIHQGGRSYRTVATPVEVVNGAVAQRGTLLIAEWLGPTLKTLATLRLILYLVGLAGIALAIVFGLAISRLTLRPVKRLTGAAEHVAATQELDATIEVEGDDELGRLADAFNEMLHALAASRRQQAQLVSDAGHELRTPLTSLRTNVELMMRAKKLPEADQRELYGDISGQIEELTTLIGDLVDMARQDEQQPEPVEVRLDSIVENAVQRARRRAPSLTFDVDLTPGSLRAQPPLLERAVLNVLDNAAKWSPPGGTVEVRLRRGETWLLEVRDHGPGIAAEDRAKVFDRFYRASAARSMPGSGLGLAIVAQVIRTHGGTVDLDDAPGGGTLVRITLPTVTEQEPATVEMPPPPTTPPPVPPHPGGSLSPVGFSGPGSAPANP